MVLFVGITPFASLANENGCEDRGDAIVCRSGPSDEEIELNRLRSLTKEERAWEMLQNTQIRIRSSFRNDHTIDFPHK